MHVLSIIRFGLFGGADSDVSLRHSVHPAMQQCDVKRAVPLSFFLSLSACALRTVGLAHSIAQHKVSMWPESKQAHSVHFTPDQQDAKQLYKTG